MATLPEADRLARLGVLVLITITSVAAYRLFRWIQHLPVPPDPWDEQTARDLESAPLTEVCPKCSQPHPREHNFCEHCGAAIGAYNNVMPYVYLFSEGEVLRTGVTGKFRVNALTIGGFLIYSLMCYLIFAPIYWYLLLRNIRRLKAEDSAPAD